RRIDAVRRQDLGLRLKIRGRNLDRPSPLLPFDHDARQRKRPSEEERRALEVAFEEKLTDARRGHDHRRDDDRLDDVDGEPVLLARSPEMLRISAAVSSVREVETDD